MKKYLELKANQDATHIKIEIYYNLGGYNCFTCKTEQRGYYLSVVPVTRERRDGYTLESFAAFTGTKQLLKSVTRKSAKAEKDAEQLALAVENKLVDFVCRANELELAAYLTGAGL